MNIQDIIRLSDLLAEMGHVKRATRLPNGELESDSHHSFSLALVAYHIVVTECPELDSDKVMRFALVHDLLEIVTGDEDTLHLTLAELQDKHHRETAALDEFEVIFEQYPELKQMMHDYEKLDTPEAAAVFVLDKACTTWTHHADGAEYAKNSRNLHTKADIEAKATRQRTKLKSRLKVLPPQKILDIYEQSFIALGDLYDE